MARRTKLKKTDPRSRLRRTAEALFGEQVRDVQTPGGTSRASCRVILESRSVIATDRPNPLRTRLEASVLEQLSAICDCVPKFLGMQNDILFQSDVGGRRLNMLIAEVDASQQADLADKAVAAIFRIQAAARQVGDALSVPPLGASPVWVEGLVEGVEVLDDFGDGVPGGFDRASASEALSVKPAQFVKWDCRSGNAALDDVGHMSWFDFEYCGRRHGAEDVAWLIGDESWPLDDETMLRIVTDNFRDQGSGDLNAYISYLSLYLSFHVLKRLELVLNETRKRGWKSKTSIRRKDDVGSHPEFAAHLCRTGVFFADRHPLTRPLVQPLEATAMHFERMLLKVSA